jgi:muconolactone delta-isomerase
MRFLVISEPKTPVPPEAVLGLYDALKAWKARYIAAGKLEQIWSFAGLGGAGAGIANVDSLEELDQISAEFPFQPFTHVTVYGLTDFDKSVENATRIFGAMLAGMAKH